MIAAAPSLSSIQPEHTASLCTRNRQARRVLMRRTSTLRSGRFKEFRTACARAAASFPVRLEAACVFVIPYRSFPTVHFLPFQGFRLLPHRFEHLQSLFERPRRFCLEPLPVFLREGFE